MKNKVSTAVMLAIELARGRERKSTREREIKSTREREIKSMREREREREIKSTRESNSANVLPLAEMHAYYCNYSNDNVRRDTQIKKLILEQTSTCMCSYTIFSKDMLYKK